ncbi:MAG: hypothetical protein ACFFAS_06200 [Promethearchaeota archaeon]
MSSGIVKKTNLDKIGKNISKVKSNSVDQDISDQISFLTKKLHDALSQGKITNPKEYGKDTYLEIVNDIHDILNLNTGLTKQQKFDYCIIERHFMKLYLQKFSS